MRPPQHMGSPQVMRSPQVMGSPQPMRSTPTHGIAADRCNPWDRRSRRDRHRPHMAAGAHGAAATRSALELNLFELANAIRARSGRNRACLAKLGQTSTANGHNLAEFAPRSADEERNPERLCTKMESRFVPQDVTRRPVDQQRPTTEQVESGTLSVGEKTVGRADTTACRGRYGSRRTLASRDDAPKSVGGARGSRLPQTRVAEAWPVKEAARGCWLVTS